MKMKPHVLAGILAAVLVMGSAMSVYAKQSVTAVPDTKHSDQYEVTDIKDSLEYKEIKKSNPTVIEAIDAVNNSTEKSAEQFAAMILKDTNEKTRESAADIQDLLKNSKFLSNFFDVHVSGNEMASSDFIRDNLDVSLSDNGMFQVKLTVPTLTKNNGKVYVLHYSRETGKWEVLWPTSIDYENKTITVEFANFSPAAVLAAFTVDDGTTPVVEPVVDDDKKDDTEDDTAIEDDKEKDTDDDDKDKDDDDDDDDHHSKSSAKSPKTGVADTWMLWFAASALLAGAAKRRH